MDQFKTQVLLLHSEQSTLDRFSAGFSDRYTVHCATTGSEALNFLGDTPIHVIVSAQNLPGMSGAEALREAKKRSPETIGILLAGDSDDDSQALVGDKEVFQVIRGGIEPQDLSRLIDGATRQARLLALADSANDMAANPDEPVSEHIIMETSENGSTIISGGTGRMPALDPKKVPPSAAVGATTVDVLVITKDEEFLTTIRESSRGMHNVRYANTLKQAEEAIRKHKVGVAVVDAAMVGGNVEKLTQHLRTLQKRLVAIVAGRRDDGEMLMDLINRGKVYRFLLKPVSPGRARLAVEASVKHHLEAPDSAFKSVGGPAPAKAAPAPQPKPKQKSRQEQKKKAAPVAKPKPAPRSATAQPAPKPAATAKSAPKPKPGKARTLSASKGSALARIDNDPSDAFGGGSSFTETVTGIVATVTRPTSSKKKPKNEGRPASLEPTPLSNSGDEFASFPNPKILGAGVIVMLAVAGIAYWIFGGSGGAPVPEEPGAAATSVTEGVPDISAVPAVAEDAVVDVDELLEEARLARDAGQIFNPPGNNAIELYLTATRAAPDNAYAAAELDATLDEALGMAEAAMLDGRAEDAAAALARVGFANPEHPRLPFLTAQVTQMQLRDFVDAARSAIRENRLEDAASAIADARALGINDSAEVDVVVDELRAARSERRVDEVLSLANRRLEEGALTSPVNDNARYYFQLALSNDSENAAAQTGLTVIASKIVLQARTEIDGGRFNTAEALLAEARQLDPASEELAASGTALSDARQRVADDRRRAEAEGAAAAERAAAQQRAEEERRAAERLAEEQRLAEQERLAAEATAAATVADDISSATEAVTDTESIDAADSAPPAAEAAADESIEPLRVATVEPVKEEPAAPIPVREQPPVAASTLTRTKYVAPRYPRSAERRNVSGWVDVAFTVTTDGSVKDIDIVGSNSGDTFVAAATKAVEKWRFEPVVEDGVTVEKRAAVRMMFALE